MGGRWQAFVAVRDVEDDTADVHAQVEKLKTELAAAQALHSEQAQQWAVNEQTTLLIRNIPSRYSRFELFTELEEQPILFKLFFFAIC